MTSRLLSLCLLSAGITYLAATSPRPRHNNLSRDMTPNTTKYITADSQDVAFTSGLSPSQCISLRSTTKVSSMTVGTPLFPGRVPEFASSAFVGKVVATGNTGSTITPFISTATSQASNQSLHPLLSSWNETDSRLPLFKAKSLSRSLANTAESLCNMGKQLNADF